MASRGWHLEDDTQAWHSERPSARASGWRSNSTQTTLSGRRQTASAHLADTRTRGSSSLSPPRPPRPCESLHSTSAPSGHIRRSLPKRRRSAEESLHTHTAGPHVAPRRPERNTERHQRRQCWLRSPPHRRPSARTRRHPPRCRQRRASDGRGATPSPGTQWQATAHGSTWWRSVALGGARWHSVAVRWSSIGTQVVIKSLSGCDHLDTLAEAHLVGKDASRHGRRRGRG